MRTITTNKTVFNYSELSDKAKENAIDNLYHINTDNEWWQFIYWEAEDLGFKITGFDTDRGSYCGIDILKDEIDICQSILDSHGGMTETATTAAYFSPLLKQLATDYELAEDNDDIDYDEYLDAKAKYDDIKEEFKQALSEDYLQMLRKDYEYQTSKEAILETIEANEYEFDEDGILA